MKTVLGFVSIDRFQIRSPGVVSPFGELSTYSRTYSKEIGGYRDDSAPGYYLSTFKVADLAGNVETTLTEAQAKIILSLVREIVAYASSHTMPYDLNDYRVAVAGALPLTVRNLDFGPQVYGHNIALPEYITFNSPQDGNMTVKIWLSDQALRNQYSDYSITVVPPVKKLDNLFLPFEQAIEFIKEITVSGLIDLAQIAKGNNPDSVVKVLTFKFVNRFNKAQTYDVNFAYLIYGEEGNYLDAIKDRTVQYLVANSSFTETQWEDILPEIFERTEHLIVPRWDRIALKNLTDSSSIYSQMLNTQDLALFPETFLDFMDASFVRTNTTSITFFWRMLQATVTNGRKNAAGKTNFPAMFPDYVPVPTAQAEGDFGRMKASTQAWVMFITTVLREAERVTPISTLPAGMRRVMRGNKLFVASSHDSVNYLVAAKWNQAFN